jgi:hypothetical protein
MMILVAGPYRSGTDDNPKLITANLRAMESAALALFRLGHVPIVGEWLALPLIAAAASRGMNDPVWAEIFHPIAERVARHCDGCLRIGGPSTGADAMIAIFEELRRPVWRSNEDVVQC